MSKTMSMILFATVFFAIIGLIHTYLWLRLVRDPALSTPWRRGATIAIVLLGLSLPLAFIVGRALPFSVSRIATYTPFVWLGVMMLLLFWFATVDTVRLGALAIRKVRGAETPDPGRRLALRRMAAGGAGLVVGGMTAAALVGAARRAVVIRQEFALARFPRALDGFRIVQITDLHLGITDGHDWFADVVRRVNDLHPDLIAITGDLVDGSVDKLGDEAAPLADLRAPHGVYFVTGNHEYYSGVNRWIEEVTRHGVRVLRNERVTIGQGGDTFDLAGVDDHEAARMAPGHGPDLAKALDGRDPGREVVLLAHQPKTALEAASHDVGLVLSGHTHGGQIWPFVGLVHLAQPWVRGAHRHESGMQVYVSQGTGTWGPPMRLGTRAEITEIVLRRS